MSPSRSTITESYQHQLSWCGFGAVSAYSNPMTEPCQHQPCWCKVGAVIAAPFQPAHTTLISVVAASDWLCLNYEDLLHFSQDKS
jgi:hypothetical protein